MYRLRHKIHHYHLWYLVPVVIIGVVSGAIWLSNILIQPRTSITQSPAVTRYIPASLTKTQTITTKGLFALQLPADWVATPAAPTIYGGYSWRGDAATFDAARRLDVYMDTIPMKMAFNRLLPVQAISDHFEVTNITSDNCVSFTDKTSDPIASGIATAKWGGVNFLCDTGNYERDVVAIGSVEGINMTMLHGTKTGAHHILLVYTDNSPSPDFEIFSSIVKSFNLL
jgi:hypothetical protein